MKPEQSISQRLNEEKIEKERKKLKKGAKQLPFFSSTILLLNYQFFG